VGGDLSAMTDTIDSELSRYLTKAGGFGLSKYLSKAIDGGAQIRSTSRSDSASQVIADARLRAAAVLGDAPRLERAPQQSLSTDEPAANAVGTAPAAPAAAQSEDADHESHADGDDEGHLSYRGTVTSAFGWRNDPFAHTPRFHGGIDIRAAYGQDVPVAGDGRVAFAGEQRGYGLTVVVQHAGGLQTRYAHLSALGVQEGDHVADGQTIGRVGRSGRSTGPHLHFELSKDGHRLDPTPLLGDMPQFKSTEVAADYSSGKPYGLDDANAGSKQ
jgi:murein DD-endopeptidase MepM/ murein hydrolase activator NlpD